MIRNQSGGAAAHRLSRLRHAVSTGFMFTSFGVGGLAMSCLAVPWLRFRLRNKTEIERFAAFQGLVGRAFGLFWFGMRKLRLFDFDPREIQADLPSGSSVMIANHPTLVDVTAICAVYPRLCCVVKTSLYDSLAIGPLLRNLGYIAGDRASGMQGAAVMQAALDRLQAGLPVLIFPEGTRSRAGEVGRLRRGAFEIAARAGVPLVVLILTCEPPTLTKEMSWYSLPRATARLRMEVQPPVSMDRWRGDARAARSHYQRLFERTVSPAFRGVSESDTVPA